MILFTFMLSNIFSNTVKNASEIKEFYHKDYLISNILKNAVSQYKNNSLQMNAFLKQQYYDHQITRYSNTDTVLISSTDVNHKKYYWEFSKDKRELPFVDRTTKAMFPNRMDTWKTLKILWEMKNTANNSDLKEYNPIKRTESADLRITLIRRGPENSKRCFNTTNADVSGDIIADGNFNKSIIIKESYFKSATISDDCTVEPNYDTEPKDPYEPPLLNSNDEVNPDNYDYIDFSNNSYILIVESLDGVTSVRIQSYGDNSGYIPTNNLIVDVIPENEGKSVHYTEFIGGLNSLIFTLLEENERTYKEKEITSADQITNVDIWVSLMKKIDEKY